MLLEAPFQIYSAAAGSGKTYTLAKTYLSLLLQSNSSRPFQHILAITFTNKAAAEMKERVLSSLHYFAHRSDQSDPVKEGLLQELSEGLSLSREYIRIRSKTLLKEILHNYSAFELTTIDAFTHKLIRSFALDLALNPGFEVTLEPHSYLREAIERLIDQIQEDPILKRLLRAMTFEQIELSKSFDISYQLFEFSKELLNERSRKKFEQNQIELAQIAQHTAALKRELEHLQERIADRAQSLLNALQEAGGNSVFKINILDNLGAMSEGRLDESKLYNETVIKQIEQSAHFKKGKEPSQSLLERIEQEYSELIDLLCERIRFSTVSSQLSNYALMRRIFNIYQSVLKEQQVLPITEFNALISEAIADQPAPYIYERIGSKYSHFFIDEFQDTSVFQWQNLKPLLSGTVESAETLKEGLVFIVGDAKQSIYRWRGGDTQQFIDLYTNSSFAFSKPATTASLETNFRSAPVIVNFNNRLFALAARRLEEGSHQELYSKTSFQQIRPGSDTNEGLVRIRFNVKEKQGDAALDGLLEDLSFSLENGYTLADMAVLVSTNSEAKKVAEYLMKAGISVISSEALDLKLNDTVKAVIALMRYTLDRGNAMHAFEVVDAAERYSAERFKRVSEALSDQESGRISGFERYLKRNGLDFDQLLKANAFVCVKSIVDQLLLSQPDDGFVYAGQIDPAFCNYLLELVYERQYQKGGGLQEFLNFYDAQEALFMPLPENDEALRVTTVHKSKGLEFDLVFYPFAVERNRSINSGKEWLAVDDLLPIAEMLLPLSEKSTKTHEPSRVLFEQERAKTALDHLNQLYVACTRAKRALFVYTEEPSPTKEGIHYPSLFYECLQQYDSLKTKDSVLFSIGELRPKAAKVAAKSSFKIPFSAADQRLQFTHSYPEVLIQESQLLGTLFHQFMQRVHCAEDIADAKNEMGIHAIAEKTPLALIDQCERWAIGLTNHADLKHLYQPSLWAKNESVLLDPDAGMFIPDRLVFADGAYTLIEYKTGVPNDAHREQVNHYAQLIDQMPIHKPKATVKERIIIYLSTLDPEITITHA